MDKNSPNRNQRTSFIVFRTSSLPSLDISLDSFASYFRPVNFHDELQFKCLKLLVHVYEDGRGIKFTMTSTNLKVLHHLIIFVTVHFAILNNDCK